MVERRARGKRTGHVRLTSRIRKYFLFPLFFFFLFFFNCGQDTPYSTENLLR